MAVSAMVWALSHRNHLAVIGTRERKFRGCTTDRWSVLWKYLTWYELQDKPFKSQTPMEPLAVKMKKAKGRNTDSIGKNRINAPFHHPFGYKSHCKSHFPPRGLIVFTLNPRLQTGR